MTQLPTRPEPAERLNFPNTIEGVVNHVLKGKVTPRLKALLLAEGVDLDRPLRPAYPADAWSRCLKLIALELFPNRTPEESYRAMGASTLDGFGETLWGRAVLAVMRLLGPRRLLTRLQRDIRASDNFTNFVVTELEKSHVEIAVNWGNAMPGYVEACWVHSCGRAVRATPWSRTCRPMSRTACTAFAGTSEFATRQE